MNWLESKRLGLFLQIILALALFVLINQLANRFYFRLDLTEEKRYSITKATKKQLSSLEDQVTVDVYLTGELPAGFKRVQQALLETLEEFNVYANGNINYQIVDPNAASTAQSRAEYLEAIVRKGLVPTDVFINEEGKRVQKRIFVGVIIRYGNQEKGVQLFKGNQTASAEERLNQSIEGIEYELANAIRQITQNEMPKIGFLKGHLEMDSLNIISFKRLLNDKYRIKTLSLEEVNTIPPALLIIAQPRTSFSEKDKYYLDQYIMKGGKTIFLLDKVAVNMDSAATGTYSFPYQLKIDDLLFRYGLRVNNDLVQDYVSSAYPIIVGNTGDKPQMQLLQWPFFPIINNYTKHVIVRNLDASRTEFVSSIDTVKADGIKKTPLLSSSAYTRVSTAPVYVDINVLREALSPDKFDQKNIAIGYLLEGKFSSLYKNRFIPEGVDKIDFIEDGQETGLIIIADGDFVKNGFDPKTGAPLPTGYDPFLRQQFANGDLILNAIQYLLEGDGLISARAKQVIIRPLDKVKVEQNKKFYQVINLVTPLLIILIIGVSTYFIRKRRYTGF